ncbi:MAG: hypothetical protein GF317_23420 [Candidatus Lokiarchaeota archaeon]|nr:hypothetical protein [Candidatus Lokiarchaeota archaeon]
MKVFRRIQTRKVNDALQFVIKNMPELIPSLITGRLFEEGVDSDNRQLQTDIAKEKKMPFYSDFTVKVKQSKKQKYTNVTLNDTGNFYNSIKAISYEKFVNILADMNKEGNHIADNFTDMYSNEQQFEKKILNLSDEDKEVFKRNILPFFIKTYKNMVIASIR